MPHMHISLLWLKPSSFLDQFGSKAFSITSIQTSKPIKIQKPKIWSNQFCKGIVCWSIEFSVQLLQHSSSHYRDLILKMQVLFDWRITWRTVPRLVDRTFEFCFVRIQHTNMWNNENDVIFSQNDVIFSQNDVIFSQNNLFTYK